MIAVEFHYTIIDTWLGHIGMISSPVGLRKVVIATSKGEVIRLIIDGYPSAVESLAAFGDLPERLRLYLNGERVTFGDTIDWSGVSSFSHAVLETVRNIPHGEVRSYGWVARQIGKPKAARAVGQALAANPMTLVVPCHRVIGSNGSLVGFTGGLKMKKRLLELEGVLL